MSLKAWLVLACALLLAGCQTQSPLIVTKLQAVHCEVPASTLACAPRPQKPGTATDITDQQAGRFIIDNDDAGQDCREKLAVVKGILEHCDAQYDAR